MSTTPSSAPVAPACTSRRDFLRRGALLGLFTGASGATAWAGEKSAPAAPGNAILNSDRPDAPYTHIDAENQILTACLQCNTGCGIKAKLQDGVITKIDGNPYNPWTLLPHLPANIPQDEAATVDGSICPKGQAGLQTAYDPFRIRKVLKRAGPRGSNKWVSMEFADAVREIGTGGKLFANVPGEETREVEGLDSIRALRDTAVAKAMAADVTKILDEKDAAKKAALVAAFKVTHAAHLDKLIDPDHPDLGPKNNQLVLAWGRLKGGRGDLYKRFASAFGTTNAHGHTTVCQGSLYFTCKAISEQYTGGKFTGGQKFYWQADLENAEFVFFVGANTLEGNYGPPNQSVRLMPGIASGQKKIAVADPRFSKIASKAWKWLPVKPGTDAALAMAFIRWMIEADRIDHAFLSAANPAAAKAAGMLSHTNGAWLVKIDAKGQPGAFARAADHGLATAEERTTATAKGDVTYTEKFFLVRQGDKFVPVDEAATAPAAAVVGDLFVDATLPDGTRVKSALQLLRESAEEHTIAEWCEIVGVRERDVIDVARELTSHGRRAAVDIHRGVAQHTNGFYNVLAWMSVNMLLGNYDRKGGMLTASAFDVTGAKGKKFDLAAHPGKPAAFGVSSIRHDIAYEKTTLFAGYPAKRNWYPIASDIYEEIIPSIGDAYPYAVKALILYMGAPTYALPAGHTNIEILRDTAKLPLFISNDILVGSTSMYADYIFPDLTYLERWEFQGSHPCMPNKVQPLRQPAMAPIPESVEVFGQRTALSLEAMLFGLAENLSLPGFGPDGLGKGIPLSHPDDYYLRGVGNLAWGEKPDGSQQIRPATEREMEIFRRARRHLPKEVFDEARWSAAVGPELWPRVVTILNQGGRYQAAAEAFKGEFHAQPYGKLLNLYQEKTAGVVHSGTGKKHSGIARYLPIRDFHGNEPTEMRAGQDFALITHRTISQTKSRTIADPWLTPLMPENALLINPLDAKRLNLAEAQEVKVTSATNRSGEFEIGPGKTKTMRGKIHLTETMRPGIVSFALGFGHWATGAVDIEVDGHLIQGEPRRAKGIHANAAMWVDPTLKNTCMLDPVGGSVSFYDTHVRLEPVS